MTTRTSAAMSVAVAMLLMLVTPSAAEAASKAKSDSSKKPRCAQHLSQVEKHPQKFLPCEIQGTSGGAQRGDFNSDGFGDLAIGVPNEAIGSEFQAGAVHVLYGTADGLSDVGNELFNQGSPHVPGIAQAGDLFGSSLAAGDFNGDGFTDLAVGSPGENANGVTNSGAVHVLYGSTSGLDGGFTQVFTQRDLSTFPVQNEAGDQFGFSLVWADFGRTGEADLAIGTPFEDFGDKTDAGAVFVLYGTLSGLRTSGFQVLHQDVSGAVETAESGDNFGAALSGANFSHGLPADLAVGVPREDVCLSGCFGGNVADAGAVQIFYGSTSAGLTTDDDQLITQALVSPAGTSALEAGDQFGSSLAAGSVDNETTPDLAIGVPFEDVGSAVNGGAVHVVSGSPAAGLLTGSRIEITQSIVGDGAQSGDQFGKTLAINHFFSTGSSINDLAIGVPFEDVALPGGGQLADAGAVNVVYGGTGFPTSSRRQVFHGNTAAGTASDVTADAAETGDRFGSALSAWSFGKGARADLAIGVPFEDVGSISNAGAVVVLYGAIGGLSVAGNQQWHQNVGGIAGAAESGDQFGQVLY